MNLIAILPPGHKEITVNGLHQWDRGRQLEIHSTEFPAVVEVHFACAGMDEAVVRTCSSADGVVVALIPDRCLEQSAPITAWIYEIDGATSGMTTKKITLPVEARTRPSLAGDVPVDTSDKYTEAVAAMNNAVAELKRLTWRSLNDLFGVERFSQAEAAGYEITPTSSQMAVYFPRGKVCVLRRTMYWGSSVTSDAQLCYISADSEGTGLAGSNFMILINGNSVHINCWADTGALAPVEFKVDIAVLE